MDLTKLNGPQREAVTTTEGPLLVLAGAGSGKTRVITYRIAHLIENLGVRPYHILAITFTNKAAKEMRDRVDLLTGDLGREVWVATFHSTCLRILRRHPERLGYETDFVVYDTDDQKTAMKQVLKSLNIDNKKFPEREMLSAISKAKNECIRPGEYIAAMGEGYRESIIAKVYEGYQKLLKKNNAMDFDDLLMNAVFLFSENEDILTQYRNRFTYIHIDEYQDTNRVQFLLVQLLAGPKPNLCVVGDDDQSIYRFRGADITNILNFEAAFPNTTVVKLEENYRSTPEILEVANAVIAHNVGRKVKRLWTKKPDANRVKFWLFEEGRDEARTVIDEIKKKKEEGESYKDMAILYRTNAQSRSFEEQCVAKNVPYRLVGGVNFYQRAEIKDVLAYLKTIASGSDDLSTRRIINVPKRGIGATSEGRIADFAEQEGISFLEAMGRVEEIGGIPKAALSASKTFFNEIRVLRAKSQEYSLDELIEEVLDTVSYEKELEKFDDAQQEAKRENINELINKAAEFEEPDDEDALTAFLSEIALVSDVDNLSEDEDKIVLMTLHAAKGLEFPRVYLVGMEENLFPSWMAINEDSTDSIAIEEERRLCYVGITRAMKHLVMTAAKARMLRGEMHFNEISRFISEIPDGMLDREIKKTEYRPDPERTQTRTGSTNPGFGKDIMELMRGTVAQKRAEFNSKTMINSKQLYVAPDLGTEELPYHVGSRIRHIRFGEGEIMELSPKPNSKDYIVTIRFDATNEVKKMMASFLRDKIEVL